MAISISRTKANPKLTYTTGTLAPNAGVIELRIDETAFKNFREIDVMTKQLLEEFRLRRRGRTPLGV